MYLGLFEALDDGRGEVPLEALRPGGDGSLGLTLLRLQQAGHLAGQTNARVSVDGRVLQVDSRLPVGRHNHLRRRTTRTVTGL